MSDQGGARVSVFSTFKRVGQLVSSNPVLMVPFLLVALSNAACLAIAFFSPRYPVSVIMAPPIQRFYGAQFLHYPQIFQLIPRLFQQGSLVISLTGGLLLTAYALYLLDSTMKGERSFDVFGAILGSLKNFIRMLTIFVVFYFAAKFLGKGAILLLSKVISSTQIMYMVSIPVDIAIITVVQSLAFFVFPAFILKKRTFFEAILEDAALVRQSAPQVVLLVLLPSLLFVLSRVILILNPYMVRMFGAEFMLVALAVSIVINTIVDMIITLSSGVAYQNVTR